MNDTVDADFERVLPDPLPEDKGNGGPCGVDVDGTGPCESKSVALGLCRKHHSRWFNQGYLGLSRGRPKPHCTHTAEAGGYDCAAAWHKNGMCEAHYERQQVRSLPTAAPETPVAPTDSEECGHTSCEATVGSDVRFCPAHTCLLDGCSERRHSGGYCDKHAAKIKRSGHPDPAGTAHAAPRPLDKVYLPVEPIVEAARRAGGYTQMLRDGLTRKERDTAAKRASRAVEANRVSMAAADDIANAMGTTPQDMWGMRWQTALVDLIPHTD